jgi:hypothetical protein
LGQAQAKQRQRWKMTAAEVMAAPALIPGNEWSPLDGTPAPEYIPPEWDGPHVGLRLIEGFKTLACMPRREMQSEASGFWPETWAEWGDYADTEKNHRIRMRPGTQEVSRMEKVLIWPGRYLSPKSVMMSRIVQSVAYLRSKDYDLGMVSRKWRMGSKHLRRVNREGLDIIAGCLRASGEPVF